MRESIGGLSMEARYRYRDDDRIRDLEAKTEKDARVETKEQILRWHTAQDVSAYVHAKVDRMREDGTWEEVSSIVITVHPEQPDCPKLIHAWDIPKPLIGEGCTRHGGGYVYVDICRHCGLSRRVDTWATDPSSGEAGVDSVSYDDSMRETALAYYRSIAPPKKPRNRRRRADRSEAP